MIRSLYIASHPLDRALIAASARGGNTGFGGSGLPGAKRTPIQPPGWLGLLEDPPKYLI